MPVLTRRARRSAAIKWLDVEPELRNMILEAVISSSFTHAYGKPERIAYLTSVWKKWQAFFEHHTFRRLVLDNGDIEFFSKALAPPDDIRFKYIRHIWLRVTLSPYECPDCRRIESWFTRVAFVNHQLFPSNSPFQFCDPLTHLITQKQPPVHAGSEGATKRSLALGPGRLQQRTHRTPAKRPVSERLPAWLEPSLSAARVSLSIRGGS